VRTFISKIEARFQPPTFATVERFADALDVPLIALVTANSGREYYCQHFLLSDPFLAEIHQLTRGFDEKQWQILADTVRSLARDHQMTFLDWQLIPATSSKEIAA
jgi:transcriptional regulator with XRE-family HTH domain